MVMSKRVLLFIGVTVSATFLGTATAWAGILLVPPGLGHGDPYRLVFVTSVKTTGESPDISHYQEVVKAAVAASDLRNLKTEWYALAGTANQPNARVNSMTRSIDPSAPIYNLGGDVVALGNDDLWTLNTPSGSDYLRNPIVYNDQGDEINLILWTGTDHTGQRSDDRLLGASSGASATGSASYTNSEWAAFVGAAHSINLSVYGISGVINEVPEPSSLVVFVGLLLFGTTCLLKRR